MKIFGKKQDDQGEELKKRGFFSLDTVASSLETKKNFKIFSEIVKASKNEDRKPVSNRAEALTNWNLDGLDEKDIEKEAKNAEKVSFLFLMTFFLVAIMAAYNFKCSGLSVLSTINAAIALSTCLSLTVVHSWQASVIKGEFTTFTEYTRKFKWIFSVVAVALYASSIQVVQAAGIDLPEFDVQLGTDLSNRLIGQIVGIPWADHGGTAMSNGLTSILIPLLEALNTGSLMFVSVFCVYIYSFGIVQIAHSGSWNDSQIFSTFWSPVRTTAAVALCAPMANGISFLQHIILIAIAMSINLANNVSVLFVDHVKDTNGITISATMGPVVEENFGKITNAALKGMAIQYAAMGIYGINLQGSNSYTVTTTTSAGQKKTTFAFTPPERVYSGSMPTITVTAPSDTISGGYASALTGVVEALTPAVSTFLSSDVSKRGDPSQLDAAIKAAHKAFSTSLIEAYKAQISNHNADSEAKQVLQNMATTAGTYGWMTTGIYPFVIARAQAQAQSLVSATIETEEGNFATALNSAATVQTPEATLIASLFNQIDSKMKALEASGAYAGMTTIGHTRTNGTGIKALWDIAADNIDSIAPSFIVKSLKESNPVAAMYSFGSSMIDGPSGFSVGSWSAKVLHGGLP